MTLAIAGNASGGYGLTKSLRFRSSATAYMSRTPSVAGNRKTFTYSVWVKRGNLGSLYCLLGGTDGSTNAYNTFRFNTNSLQLAQYNSLGTDYILTTSASYIDIAGWYHIVWAYDSTQATSTNRIKLYVNGVQVTSFTDNTYPALNTNNYINNTTVLNIGRTTYNGTTDQPFDGYMTEINFVDGQALTPSSFGAYDATTGVWQPIKYTGSYGTNGFYLPFINTTSTTTLGYDFSPNGNNFTTTNFSLTSGSTYDSMNDVPTLTGITAANYPVINGLVQNSGARSDGNLKNVFPGTASNNSLPTIFTTTGKFYAEMTCVALSASNGGEFILGDNNGACAVGYRSSGTKDVDSYSTDAAYGASWTVNDVIGMAADLTNKSVTFYKNGVSQGAISYTGSATNLNLGIQTSTRGGANMTFTMNFGQQPWAYSPPSGYVAMNTYNLTAPAVPKGNVQMDATLFTSTGTTQTVTNAGGFQPDLIWTKKRSAANNHLATDSVRGISKYLIPNLSNAEGTDAQYITSINSNGFTLGTSNFPNGDSMVAWQWKASGTTVTNTNGSITSTVSANPTAGFSIVSYTGTGSAGTIGHGLGVAPVFYVIKLRSGVGSWTVFTTVSGSMQYAYWDNTNAFNLAGETAPTSTTIYTNGGGGTGASGQTYVAYCWTPIAGFSKFGTYTGTGTADYPFIYTGFRPKYVVTKKTNAAESWVIYDSSQSPYNYTQSSLYINSTTGTDTVPQLNILSNGFSLHDTHTVNNNSGDTYFYMAFAENPFKYALAR